MQADVIATILDKLHKLSAKVAKDCPKGKHGVRAPRPVLPTKPELMHWQLLLKNKALWELRRYLAPPMPNGVPAQLQSMAIEQLDELLQQWLMSEFMHGNLPSMRLSVIRSLQVPASGTTPGLLRYACGDIDCKDRTCLGNRLEWMTDVYSQSSTWYNQHPSHETSGGWDALTCPLPPPMPEPACSSSSSSDWLVEQGLSANASQSSMRGGESDEEEGEEEEELFSEDMSTSGDTDGEGVDGSAGPAGALPEQPQPQQQQRQRQQPAPLSIADLFARAAGADRPAALTVADAHADDAHASGDSTTMHTANSGSAEQEEQSSWYLDAVPTEASVPPLVPWGLIAGLKLLKVHLPHHKMAKHWGDEAVSFILPFDAALAADIFLKQSWPRLNLALTCNKLFTQPHKELAMDDSHLTLYWKNDVQELNDCSWVPFAPSLIRNSNLDDTVLGFVEAVARAPPELQARIFGTSTVMTNTIGVWKHYIRQKEFNHLVLPCLDHLARVRHEEWKKNR